MVKVDGRKLRSWRERRLLTLRELEERSGVAYATIQGIETGRQDPKISTLRKLIAALGITADDVLAAETDLGEAAA